LLFLCVPFIVFGVLWYEKSTETIETNAIQSSGILVSQINNELDRYFADLERATFPVVTHPLIQKWMRLSNDPYEQFVVSRDIEKEVLPNFLFGRPDILGFYVVTENGIASYGGVSSKERNMELFRQYKDTTSFRVVGARKQDQLSILTVVRTFRDAATYKTLGMLVIDLNFHQISQILNNVMLGQTGYIWIADNNGNILYHPEHANEGQPVGADLLERFRDNKEGYFLKQTKTGKTLVIFHSSPLTGWTIVSEVPLGELIGHLIALRNATIWIAVALLLFVLTALASFSFNLTRSLSVLQRLMKRAENGDLAVKAPEHRQDEIGNLYRGFNNMVKEIRRLIEVVHKSELKEKELQLKQREAMMQAMQSQINPHFLYNTLEVINSYAVLEGVMPISNMATSLADLFRYSVGNSRQIVSLKDELDHVKTYLAIQKERYPYLSFDCAIDDDLAMRVQAVRLILQPLVENAIIHGYERNKRRPEYVGLTAEPLEDCCLVRIIDCGSGMDPELKTTYNRIFAGAPSGNESDLPYQRIGLLNVHHRIRLTYGERYGLFIEQSDATGTVIRIRLPYARMQNGEDENLGRMQHAQSHHH
jgi:two-component system sensor histidine kinase YesM